MSLANSTTLDLLGHASYAVANALRPKREGNLFEQFLVVGLPTNAPTSTVTPKTPQLLKPQVLYKYPNKDINVEYLEHFCFPFGVEARALERTRSCSKINEILFGQMARMEEAANSYIFLITKEDYLLYGICVAQTELVEKPFTSLPLDNCPEAEPLARTRYDFVGQRCYCFLSRFPFFRLHFEVLYSILAKERLLRIASTMGVLQDENLKLHSETDQIEHLLRAYHEIGVPKETIKFQLPGELRALEFTCPQGDEDKQFTDWGMCTLFQLVSVDNILIIFQAMLLEKQVVVVSKDLGILSAVVLSLLPLLRPYVFQGPFIPILPDALLECLEAPVPFVYGLNQVSDDLVNTLADKFVLHLDKDLVNVPSDVTLPHLPKSSKLKNELLLHQKEIRTHRQKANPYIPPNDKVNEALGSIIKTFKSYHGNILHEVILANVKSPVPNKNDPTAEPQDFDFSNPDHAACLLTNIPAKYREYMQVFLESQHFMLYSEKLADVIKKQEVQKNSPSNSFKTRLFRFQSEADLKGLVSSLRSSFSYLGTSPQSVTVDKNVQQ